MASHQDFVDYVAEQLRAAGMIRSRKMFGEYGLYCDGVFSPSSAMISFL